MEEIKQQNSGGFKNEFDDDEQSPHYQQHTSMTDTSISTDLKKDSYEQNR